MESKVGMRPQRRARMRPKKQSRGVGAGFFLFLWYQPETVWVSIVNHMIMNAAFRTQRHKPSAASLRGRGYDCGWSHSTLQHGWFSRPRNLGPTRSMIDMISPRRQEDSTSVSTGIWTIKYYYRHGFECAWKYL